MVAADRDDWKCFWISTFFCRHFHWDLWCQIFQDRSLNITEGESHHESYGEQIILWRKTLSWIDHTRISNPAWSPQLSSFISDRLCYFYSSTLIHVGWQHNEINEGQSNAALERKAIFCVVVMHVNINFIIWEYKINYFWKKTKNIWIASVLLWELNQMSS